MGDNVKKEIEEVFKQHNKKVDIRIDLFGSGEIFSSVIGQNNLYNLYKSVRPLASINTDRFVTIVCKRESKQELEKTLSEVAKTELLQDEKGNGGSF